MPRHSAHLLYRDDRRRTRCAEKSCRMSTAAGAPNEAQLAALLNRSAVVKSADHLVAIER